MTYYAKLKPIVLKYLEAYHNDFLVYDKKLLRTANKFILGMRKTGTDLLDLENLNEHNIAWCIDKHNKRFFYGINGNIEEISFEVAKELAVRSLEGIQCKT